MSISGVRIQSKNNWQLFNYSDREWDTDDMEKYFNNKGHGEYKLLEGFDYNDNLYLVYGFDQGWNNFNSFDLMDKTAYGDIIICKVDNERFMNPLNVNINEIRDFYFCHEDIGEEDTDMEDIGDYDYSDPFIAPEFGDIDGDVDMTMDDRYSWNYKRA